MNQSTAQIDIPVADPQPMKIKLAKNFTSACLIFFQCVLHILILPSTAIRAGLCHLWAYYYRSVVNGGEGVVVMPHSALAFIVNALIALAEIKSQGQTHPLAIIFSVITLLVFGLASVAELVISSAGLEPTSVYAVTAHLTKILSFSEAQPLPRPQSTLLSPSLCRIFD